MTECDEISLKAIEEMQADLVKTSNEMTSMMAGFENEINKYEVSNYNVTFNVILLLIYVQF